MAREPIKKPGSRIKRDEFRRAMREGGFGVESLLMLPGVGTGLMIWLGFALLCAVVAIWAREQPLVAPNRVMNTTEVVRIAFLQEDEAETEERRQQARQNTPRVYVSDEAQLAVLRTTIERLPATLAAAADLSQVDASIRQAFDLNAESLEAVRAEGADGGPSAAWRQRTTRLAEALARRPLLENQTWQRESQSMNREVELRVGGQPPVLALSNDLVNVDNREQLRRAARTMASEAGFSGPALDAVVARLTANPAPTFRYDPVFTAQREAEAAGRIQPTRRERSPGQTIFTRGETLTPAAYDLYRAELDHFLGSPEARWRVWLRRLSITGAVIAITLAMAGYATLFSPRIRRRPERVLAVAGLLSGMLLVACLGTVADPGLLTLTAVAPTVFVAVMLAIAYDQRTALGFGALHGILVCIALNQPIGIFALIIAGVGMAIWQLKEIRDRGTLIRMSLYCAFALAVGTLIVALIDRPITVPSLRQTLADAGLAAFGGLFVGMFTLFILDRFERTFDITTAMRLIELRDPKNPLLRQLLQRAPGTYNHSLTVANLAEAAADAIKANALLTYVGALYHDIGKMNKPDYFVENQTPGINKHDKLSPAMSLLVIVGHVKDGMELAREFGLPRDLHHFIEAHHGTTLVEYFYHRARKLAAAAAAGPANGNGNGNGGAGAAVPAPGGTVATTAAGADVEIPVPEEIEYRYPGPKPRTKEVAIVMLCDAVESAVRSMPNPTPGRIDAIVRALAQKRLMDGQFDESELTLRELNTLVETVSKTLAAIYHGRIAYPDGGTAAAETRAAETRTSAGIRLEAADSAASTAEAVGKSG